MYCIILYCTSVRSMGSNVVLCATCVDVTDRKLRLFVQAKCQVCLFVCVCVAACIHTCTWIHILVALIVSMHA